MNIHKIKKRLVLLTALLVLITMLPAHAYEGLPEMVRIGLFFDSGALTEAEISSDANAVLYEGDSEVVRGYAFTVKVEENGVNVYINDECVYTLAGDRLTFVPTEDFLRLNSKPYRGSIELIKNNDGRMTAVNIVGLEDYLYGVVPLEMATGFPAEALKCQAICARTYAVQNIGRYAAKGFDLTNTTHSQVYGGVDAEKADCTLAVNETSGQVLTYNGMPAQVYYFSVSSGVTLNSQDVWAENIPYLQSVEDSWQHLVIPDYKAWEVTYTADEATQRMKALGFDVGDVTMIEATAVNAQGAVMELVVTGTGGSHKFKKEGCRNAFSLKSQTFTVSAEGATGGLYAVSAGGVSELSGNYYARGSDECTKTEGTAVITANGIEKVNSGVAAESFTMKGTGWGHGIGMSQNGAKGMAQSGFTCEQILTHYFKGTQIQ